MNEAIRLALTMLCGGMLAILLLMMVAGLTGKVHTEEKQGREAIYNIQATVKGKRTLVEPDPDHPELLCTRYFVTFQKQDGLRVEMETPGEDYGLAAEGDEGILVYAGENRFIVFKRL